MEAQRALVTGPKSHSLEVAETKLDPDALHKPHSLLVSPGFFPWQRPQYLLLLSSSLLPYKLLLPQSIRWSKHLPSGLMLSAHCRSQWVHDHPDILGLQADGQPCQLLSFFTAEIWNVILLFKPQLGHLHSYSRSILFPTSGTKQLFCRNYFISLLLSPSSSIKMFHI